MSKQLGLWGHAIVVEPKCKKARTDAAGTAGTPDTDAAAKAATGDGGGEGGGDEPPKKRRRTGAKDAAALAAQGDEDAAAKAATGDGGGDRAAAADVHSVASTALDDVASTVLDEDASSVGGTTASEETLDNLWSTLGLGSAVRTAGSDTEQALSPSSSFGPSSSLALEDYAAVVCHQCNTQIDTLQPGVRLLSKMRNTWRCKTCNSKCSMLSTMFGGWPIEDFKHLTPELQTKFWQAATSDVTSLKKAVEEHIIIHRVRSRWNERVGDYQPLSWYTAHGYDVSTFSKTAASEWNEDMGVMTYKIGVHKVGDRNLEDIARDEIYKLLDKGKKSHQGAAPVPVCKPQITEGEGESEGEAKDAGDAASSSSSSSSTSSSSSSAKKKKQKKSKKEKKVKTADKERKDKKKKDKKEREAKLERKKQEAERKRQEAEAAKHHAQEENKEKKRVAKLQIDAARILSKVSPLVGHIKELKGHAHFSKVPKDAKKNVDATLKDLEKVMAYAEERVRGSSTEAFPFTVEEASATAKGGIATLRHFLNTIKQTKQTHKEGGQHTKKATSRSAC